MAHYQLTTGVNVYIEVFCFIIANVQATERQQQKENKQRQCKSIDLLLCLHACLFIYLLFTSICSHSLFFLCIFASDHQN